MTRLKIVAVSAGLWVPSKTTSLAREILSNLGERFGAHTELVELGPIAPQIGASLSRGEAPADVAEALLKVEAADVLVAATPVFRGSFTGHFKHFFDLIEIDALRGVPVVLAATGGGEKHCLVLEHALRPLFGFFQAFSVPSGVYATDKDFENGKLTGRGVDARIQAAVAEVALLLAASAPRARSLPFAPGLGAPGPIGGSASS